VRKQTNTLEDLSVIKTGI